MKRLRPILIAAAVLLFAAAWLGVARISSDDAGATSTADRDVAADVAAGGAAARGRGGVEAAQADLSAAARVSGVVVDEDELPVSGGKLVLSCLHADDSVRRIEGGVVSIADDGRFEGPGCRYEVCAQLLHPALVPAEPWVLQPGRAQQLPARHLARLHGVVLDPTGAPVEAADIVFVPHGPDPDPTAVLPVVTRSTTTDADGTFSVGLIERPPCDACAIAQGRCDEGPLPVHTEVEIAVRAPGWAPTRISASIDALPEDGLSIELQASEDPIRGRLVDPSGNAYPRAYILARSVERPDEQRRADPSGDAFEVQGLGSGPHDLRAIQDRVELARASAVLPGEDVVLRGELPADGPDVVVQVLDEQGRAIQARLDGGPFVDHLTDAQGRAQADAVLPGELRLRVRPVGKKAIMVTLEVPDLRSRDPIELQVRL